MSLAILNGISDFKQKVDELQGLQGQLGVAITGIGIEPWSHGYLELLRKVESVEKEVRYRMSLTEKGFIQKYFDYTLLANYYEAKPDVFYSGLEPVMLDEQSSGWEFQYGFVLNSRAPLYEESMVTGFDSKASQLAKAGLLSPTSDSESVVHLSTFRDDVVLLYFNEETEEYLLQHYTDSGCSQGIFKTPRLDAEVESDFLELVSQFPNVVDSNGLVLPPTRIYLKGRTFCW